MRKLTFAAIAVAMLSVPASAQNIATNNGIWWGGPAGGPSAFTFLNPLTTMYGRIGVIHAWQNSPNVHTALGTALSAEMGNAWGGVLGMGARLMPAVRFEIQMSGLMNEQADLNYFGIQLGRVRVSSVQVLNNLYLDAAPIFGGMGRFNVFVMAGVGVAFNRTNDTLIFGEPPQNGSGNARTAFAWNAGAGAQYQVMDHAIIELAYRYVDGGGFRINDSPNISASRSTSLTSHQVMFSLVVPFAGLIRGFGN